MEISNIKIKEIGLRNIRIPKFFHFGLLFLILIFTFLIIAAPAANAGTIIKSPAYLGLSRGLVGCWNFDGSYTKVQDCTSNNNDGTLTNGPLRRAGKIGQALDFDGADDHALFSTETGIANLTAVSISAWIKPRTSGEGGFGNILDKTSSGAGAWRFMIKTSFTPRFEVDYDGASNLVANINADDVIEPNTWNHLIVIWDGSTARANVIYYINGVRTASDAGSDGVGSVVPDTGALKIGSNDTTDRTFNGLIDDIRLYNRAISDVEAMRLYRIGLGSTANRPTSSLQNGLVGCWNFDGSYTKVPDCSGRGNTGTVTNGPVKVPGKLGQALNFDGSNDFVDSTADFIGTGATTLSVWIKPDTAGNQNSIISNQNYICQYATSPANTMACSNNNGATQAVTASGAIPLNQWTHFIAVRNGSGQFTFYVNSVQSGTANQAGGTMTAGTEVSVGSDDEGGSYFDGIIDDVRIYNRALSASEISRLYNSTQSKFNSSKAGDVMTKGLVGHWTFDGADIGSSGTIAKDRSGNNNNGTLTGANGLPVQKIGKVGQALSFDGVNDAVSVADKNELDLTGSAFTLSAWIKPTGFGGSSRAGIIDKDGAFNNGWNFKLDDNQVGSGLSLEINANAAQVSNNNAVTLNVWQHVMVTFNGGNVAFYVNGVPAGTATGAATPVANAIDVWIGGTVNASRYFPGLIDDVRIYNRALSAGEINKLYQMGR